LNATRKHLIFFFAIKGGIAAVAPKSKGFGRANLTRLALIMINMSILSWILLGLIAGFLGSKVVNRHGEGIFLDIVLGIVGAVAGGYLFSFFGAGRVTGLNLYSVLVATLGAIVVLVVYHGVRRMTLRRG
jgi:uncharacterized membrane protein YeaQ/YmgE (transglycosylase-associated protein family)